MLNFKLKNTKEILKVLNVTEKIIDKNINNEVLKQVLFKNNNGLLRIEARNSNMFIRYDLEVEYISGDSILYNNKMLINLLNLLNGEVEINNGQIKNDKCNYKVAYSELNENLKYMEANKDCENIINFKEFKNSIENILQSTSNISGVTSGIYVNDNEIAACDGQRISISQINDILPEAILPKYLVNDTLKLPFEDNISISIDSNKVTIKDSNILITSMLVNGKFPKYDAFLPKEKNKEIIVESNKILDAINLLIPILDNNKIIDLKITKENINLSANSNNQEGNTDININSDLGIEEEIQIKLNAQFLIDALKNSEKEVKIITYKDHIGIAVTFSNVYHLIMPIVK